MIRQTLTRFCRLLCFIGLHSWVADLERSPKNADGTLHWSAFFAGPEKYQWCGKTDDDMPVRD